MGEPKYHVSDIPATRFTAQKNAPCQPSDERTSTALESRVLGPSEGDRPQGLSVSR